MVLPVTSLSVIALGVWFIILTARVVDARRASGVSLGDGGDTTLIRRQRAQGNLCENAPFGLALIAVAEIQTVGLLGGLYFWLLAIAALAFVVGRLMHGYAFGFTDNWPLGRVGGMTISFVAMIACAVLAMIGVFL